MATWKQICTATGVLALAGMLNAPLTSAQSDLPGGLRVRKIEDQKMRNPDLRVSNPGTIKGDWYRVTTEYSTESPWLDDLEITYYVLFEPDPRRAGTTARYLLLRGVGQYVNVKSGRHISEVYIHPNTIDRYGSILDIAVVFKSGGRLLGTESMKQDRPGWWQQLSPIDGLILNRAQTPYNPISPDHYEASKAIAVTGR